MKRYRVGLVLALVCVAGAAAQDAIPFAEGSVEYALYTQGFGVAREPLDAQQFELADVDGDQVELADFVGKVTILNFWATWCGPCRAEMPSMQEVWETYRSRGFEIVAVNLMEDRNTVKSYLDESGYEFPVLMDTEGRVGSMYGAQSIPTSYVLNREGKIIAGLVGTLEWDTPEIIEVIELLLDEA